MERASTRRRAFRKQRRRALAGLNIEALEGRQLLATLTVNSTADTNARDTLLTFREAILVANGTLALNALSASEQAQITGALNTGTGSPADVIGFNIPGAGLKTIAPGSALPAITDPVVIDGLTQPGTAANSLTNGTNATLLIATPVPSIEAGHSTIRGLVITGGGLVLRGGDNLVEGNFIGTDASGTQAPGLAQGAAPQKGVVIESNNNTVGGTTLAARNLISGNNQAGVHINGGSSNQILGNLIGTNALGTAALGNSLGVLVTNGSANAIGGSASGARNVISGNTETGIRLAAQSQSDTVANNLVAGNWVGLNAAGTAAIGNGNGVFIAGSATTVGGTAAGAGNVISGNPGGGLGLFNATGTLVQGNHIGTNPAGASAIGNGEAGVVVAGAVGTSIGGTVAGARNVISGNQGHGIFVNAPGTGTVINGNFIGLTDSVTALGNAKAGIHVVDAGSGVEIGGAAVDDGNVIYYNGAGGVVVLAGKAVRIRSNSIYGNTGPGIDLAGDGNTPNDNGDVDSGPNNLQNTPKITLVTSNGTTTTINGTLDSAANTNFTLQFFSNSFADPTNFGEGQIFLGEAQVTTDSNGQVTFIATVNGGVAAGQPVTAVAIDPQGNTSEFSADVPYTPDPAADLKVDVSSPVSSVLVGQNATFTVTVTNLGANAAQNVSLVVGLSPGSTFVSATPSQGTTSTSTGAVETSLGMIAANGTATLTVVLNAAKAGPLGVGGLVYSAAADPVPGNNSATKVITAVSPPNLATTVTAPAQSAVNQDVTLVFKVTNPSQNDATNVVLTTGALPANTTIVSSTASQGTVQNNNGVLTATFGTIAGGANATLTVVLHPTTTGTLSYSATATLAEADPDPSNNVAVASVPIVTPADVAVEVVGLPNPVIVGQPITFTVVIKNKGASDALNVQLQGTLTPGGTFISADPSQGTATPGSGTLSANLGTIAAGKSATLTIVVTPSAAGTAKLDTSVTALVDADPANNSASASVVVNALPATVTISDIRAWTNRGAIRGYVLTFSGPVDPASAADRDNYRIVANGRSYPIRNIGYDVITRQVTLATGRVLPTNQFVYVGARGEGTGAILSGPNTPIDGDNNGIPGGDFLVLVGRGRKFKFTDASGDIVTMTLSGPGAIEIIRGPDGDVRALLVDQTIPGRSVLRGNVKRGKGGQGEGVTRIPVAIGLNNVRNLLPPSRFLIG